MVNAIDENTRRYYLEVMGIQCWESLAAPEQVDEYVTSDESSNLSLLESAVENCEKCELHKLRKQTILGRGDLSADLMFVVLAPDEKDDAVATICSGEKNDLFAKMLAAINISIDSVYITSLLKCSVPSVHTVSTTELHHCNDYLKQQIQLVKPKLLVVLGETAATCMLQKKLSLDDLRAAVNNDKQENMYESIPLFVSYSPDELIKESSNKRKAWLDLQQIQSILQG